MSWHPARTAEARCPVHALLGCPPSRCPHAAPASCVWQALPTCSHPASAAFLADAHSPWLCLSAPGPPLNPLGLLCGRPEGAGGLTSWVGSQLGVAAGAPHGDPSIPRCSERHEPTRDTVGPSPGQPRTLRRPDAPGPASLLGLQLVSLPTMSPRCSASGLTPDS